jgi:hypothetical protein
MDIGSILLIVALGLLVAAYIARPLLADHSSAVSEREHRLSALLAERDRLLDALLELDFDNQMGKVPEDLYPEQRAGLMERAAAVLKEVDALEPEAAAESRAGAAESDPLEAMIARRRAEMKKGRAAGKSARKSGAVAARTGGARFCHACGKPIQPGDRFCPNCGAALG